MSDSPPKPTAIRLYKRMSNGDLTDLEYEYDIRECGGFCPGVGDHIIDSGVVQGRDRADPSARTIWLVEQRIFRPRGQSDYVVLVVKALRPSAGEMDLFL